MYPVLTEKRYFHFEKEALAIMYCVSVRDYVVGKPAQLEMVHKPLVQLLRRTHLDRMPP